MTGQLKSLFISPCYCLFVFSESSFLEDNDMYESTEAGEFGLTGGLSQREMLQMFFGRMRHLSQGKSGWKHTYCQVPVSIAQH